MASSPVCQQLDEDVAIMYAALMQHIQPLHACHNKRLLIFPLGRGQGREGRRRDEQQDWGRKMGEE